MAVILRLQGLNIEAGLEDIRRFFHGLHIPEGGVHITGGQMGEAFIIFSTERAGQLAMLNSGKLLRGSPVTLNISSMDELKRTMELKLKKRKRSAMENEHVLQTTPATDLCTSVLLSLVAAIQGLQSTNQTSQSQPPPVTNPQLPRLPKSGQDANKKSPVIDQTPSINQARERVTEPLKHHDGEHQRGGSEVNSCKPGYLRLYGLPNTATKGEVCQFLGGLSVVEVITNAFQGRDRCCLVKMASFKDAEDGLKYSDRKLEDFHIEVRLAHERMWTNAMEHRENSPCSPFSEQERISPDRRFYRNSPIKRRWSPLGSPKHHRSDSVSFGTEYCVMVTNLPNNITKTELKLLFSCPDLPNSKVMHLLNKWRERTSTTFITFTQPEEYAIAMNMNGSHVGSQIIDVSSITREKMRDIMSKNRFTESENPQSYGEQAQSALSCIYARNFPAGVRKADVKVFFRMYNISENNIKLLEDKNGNGIGEAVIQFGCEEHAREARSLHRELFMGEQILLTCISPQQMDILHKAL